MISAHYFIVNAYKPGDVCQYLCLYMSLYMFFLFFLRCVRHIHVTCMFPSLPVSLSLWGVPSSEAKDVFLCLHTSTKKRRYLIKCENLHTIWVAKVARELRTITVILDSYFSTGFFVFFIEFGLLFVYVVVVYKGSVRKKCQPLRVIKTATSVLVSYKFPYWGFPEGGARGRAIGILQAEVFL